MDFSKFLFTKRGKVAIMSKLLSKCTGGSMDRASDSGSEGWGFESLPVYQKFQIPIRVSGIFNARVGLERTAPVRTLV